MLLIGNGRLITRDEKNTFFDNGAVLIDGKVIQKVGTTQELKMEYPDAEYIDAKGGVIMPALINTHEHIYSAMARGLSINGYNPDGFLDILDGMWWTIDRHLTLEQVKPVSYTHLEVYKRQGHKVPDRLGGILKSRIIRIYPDLGHHGDNRNIIMAPAAKFFPQSVLQIIADVSLAHGYTDREGSVGLFRIFTAQRGHGIVNHSYLWAVSVGYDDFMPFFYEIGDGFGGDFYSGHLFRQGISQGIAAQGYDNSFFTHNFLHSCVFQHI